MIDRKNSSPSRPIKKAGTRTRSTSSSTTAKTKKALSKNKPAEVESATLPTADILTLDSETRPLSPQEKRQYLRYLSQGASPAAACLKLGITTADLAFSLDLDRRFLQQSNQVKELLSQNVAAALYRSAMEGSVSAQTFFLKNCPPPDWPEDQAHPSAKPLEELSDEELIKKFRETAPELLARLSTENSDSPDPQKSKAVPKDAQTAK